MGTIFQSYCIILNIYLYNGKSSKTAIKLIQVKYPAICHIPIIYLLYKLNLLSKK